MSASAESTRFTPEQYLAQERKSQFRSEYVNGYVRAMSGASRPHNLIVQNLSSEIHSQLKERPCESYVADMRVYVGLASLYTYPDIGGVCGEPQFQDNEFDSLLNPTALIEILSPSTEAYDRGRKFAGYRRLESLQEYVLVAQDFVSVERYTRQGQGEWVLTEYRNLDDVLRLSSIDCQVPLRAIYARVLRLAPGETNGPGPPPEKPETD